MKLVNVIPEKIHCSISLDTDEIHLLKKALAMCELVYDGDNPEEVKTKDFFVNNFSKFINDIHKELLEVE